MLNLQSGDRVELFYEDAPAPPVRATVGRLSTDRDEGMGLEVQSMLFVGLRSPWMGPKQVVLLGTDFQYRLNGRRVTLLKRQD